MVPKTQQAERPLIEVVRELKAARDAESNFRLLFDRHYGQVCGFFQRKGLSPEDSRDLAQEVFLCVHRKIRDLRDDSQFTAWLFALARSVMKSELERRHAKKRAGVHVAAVRDAERDQNLDLDGFADPKIGGGALGQILDREKLQTVVDAMTKLPSQMRRCFQLRVTAESTYEEIAAVMGISINTVKAHIHKARQELKETLAPYFDQVEGR